MFIKTKSKNQIIQIRNQSAGNLPGSSETIRKLSVKEIDWLSGIIDGDGNFDIRNLKNSKGENKRTLKQIRITQHPRDSRILYRVKDMLGGTIRVKGKKYILWSISTAAQMKDCIKTINGRVRLKIKGFKEACELLNVKYIEPNYKIEQNSAYLAGLIDTDGSIVYNYRSNIIDVSLEFQQNEYTTMLDLAQVIPETTLSVIKLIKRNKTAGKIFYSIRFVYQTIDNMMPLYKYAQENRLYSDFKYYRIMQIKRFVELREYKEYPRETPEYELYKNYVKEYVTKNNESKAKPRWMEEL